MARVVTDPACPWSWGFEPRLRKLAWEFREQLEMRWVMGGLARRYGAEERGEQIERWLEVAGETEMPVDPRLWSRGGISSSYPACQAVVAACEQGPEAGGRYLRRLREGIFCERRRLDNAETLIAEAGPAGLDVPRFEVDLRSNAIVEALGAQLEEARDVPEEAREQGGVGETAGRERLTFPSVIFVAKGGERHGVYGHEPYERLREAAIAAGASPRDGGPPEVLGAIDRFGRCATAELEALTGRPRVVVEAELWGLAREWRLRPVTVLTGTLWERA